MIKLRQKISPKYRKEIADLRSLIRDLKRDCNIAKNQLKLFKKVEQEKQNKDPNIARRNYYPNTVTMIKSVEREYKELKYRLAFESELLEKMLTDSQSLIIVGILV